MAVWRPPWCNLIPFLPILICLDKVSRKILYSLKSQGYFNSIEFCEFTAVPTQPLTTFDYFKTLLKLV